ncbi:eukaryotic translation initiation factor 3 subunit D [Alternaria sp. MG1]|nr:eukaryotic translation initiation factor 3 subunit D [Alternaria sp. MG1]
MAPASLLDLVSALPDTAGWGPPVTSESMLDGVPFAPYSKADKLGRMADWTEGKDRERGGRQQYGNRNYRDQQVYGANQQTNPFAIQAAEEEATFSVVDNTRTSARGRGFGRGGGTVFIDKRDGSSLDMVTVNENAADAPLEISEGNKDSINSPGALMLEATHINNIFPLQVVSESETQKVNMPHEHPFYNEEVETDPPASKAYRYRRFDLSLDKDEEPLHLVVRTELDAVVKNNINGEDQYLTIKALNEFDNKAQGAGGALDWRSKLASQRGAVLATEMKNNSCKLARWTVQSILAKADTMKLGFVSRTNPKNNNDHVILGVLTAKPRDFAAQMALNLNNGWAIVRTIVDMVLRMDEGKYVLVKDPNKSLLRLYSVPMHTFEEEDVEEMQAVEEDEE